MSWDDLKTKSDIITSWITVIGLLVGAAFAVYEFYESKEKDRIERTFKFYSDFHAPEFQRSKDKFETQWVKNSPTAAKILNATDISPEQKNQKYSENVISQINTFQLHSDLIKVIVFLENVAVCVKLRLCDEASAREFFGTYGKNLFRTYYPYINDLRNKWKDQNFARSLETFYNAPTKAKDAR